VLHDCDADEVLVSPKASWRSKSTQPGPGTKTVIDLASAVEFVSSAEQSFSGSSFPVLSKNESPAALGGAFWEAALEEVRATRAAAPKSQVAKMTVVPQQFIFGGTNPYPWAVWSSYACHHSRRAFAQAHEGSGSAGRLGERPATPRLHHHKLSARNVPRSAAFFRELGG
jgi:hypothetical protein